jgi:3-O-methylgallate 3,4-dioxygenase
MAQLVAAFGSSHSPMLSASLQDWQGRLYLDRDRARALLDLDGNPVTFDDLVARAPADAAGRITPEALARRHGEMRDAVQRLAADIADARLDALVVIGDDQQELFDETNMPAIGIYYGDTIPAAERERIIARPCHPELARHLIGALGQDGFDLSVMRETPGGRTEGHAFSYIHRFCLPEPPLPIVPLFLNAYYPPNQPAPSRCYALGRSLARAIAAWEPDRRVGIIASGGLSHFVVDEAFDHAIIDALRHKNAAFLADAPLRKLQSGSSEIRNWICLAGAVEKLHLEWVSYVPGYRTPALTGTGLCFASFR